MLNKYYLSISAFLRKRYSFKSATDLMAISFIQYPFISSENVNLDKTKLKNVINFEFKFFYILFYTLLAIFFIITKI